MKVKDMMHKGVECASPDTAIDAVAKKMRELDGLDDLRRAVPARARRVEQVGVGADAGEFEFELLHHVENHLRMRVEAERRREAVLRPESRAVVVVGKVGVVDAERANHFKLPPHRRERFHQSKTSDFHVHLPFC